ncbi:MAG: discoidin domain-containing protein [Bryobacteraceae bacterium]|nr:discoidin domain-containing protein [Bryobacteraceae bacterium]
MHPLIAIVSGGLLPLAASLGLGRLLWRGRAPHWTFELASGAAVLSALLFVLLVLHWAWPAVVLPLCAACSLPALRRPSACRSCAASWWMSAIFAGYGLYYVVHALAPEIQPDAAVYHLGLVAEWARQHGMPAHIGFYELLPLGLETLFYPAFLIGGHSAAKLVHAGFLFATVPLIAWTGEKLGLDIRAAFAAAGLYFFAPVAGISGSSAYNDAAAAFFPLAAFGLLMEARGPRADLVFHAGLAAGFSYAVKMPGAVAVAGAAAWAAGRHGRRGLALAAAGMLVAAAWWPVRNLVLTGNPIAPLGNRLFPNDHFHAASEAALSQTLASYGGVRWHEIPQELVLRGARLQGLAGPALLLLPLGLLAWRRPQARPALLAGLLLLAPWTKNIGARFLLPALPFLFLALAAWARPRWMQALFLLQAAACSPWALDAYADGHAWRLRGFPWRAALRLEPESEFLRRELYEYSFLEKAAPLVGSGGLLDLYGLPYAYLRTVPLGSLSSARFDNAAAALTAAAGPRPERIAVLRAETGTRLVRAVRVRLERDWPGLWSIEDVSLEWRSRRIPASPRWLLDATPNPGDAWLALDANPATRWFTWDDSRAGASWQVTFDRPRPVDAILVRTVDANPAPPVSLKVLTLERRWNDVSGRLRRVNVERRLWRREAVLFVESLGVRWIAVPTGDAGYGPIGRSMRALPGAWGVELALEEKGIALFRIRHDEAGNPPGR